MEKAANIERIDLSREQVINNYNRLSRWYDYLEAPFEKKWRKRALGKLPVKTGDQVLEVGFGTGEVLLKIAEKVGNTGMAVGIDLSDKMITVTKEKLKKRNLSERTKLYCGDAVRLPFADDHFDNIYMSFTLELFDTPEIPLVLKECRRVLKAGGNLSLVSLSKTGKKGLMRKLYSLVHRKFPVAIDCRPIYVRSSVEQAGFQIIEAIRGTMWGLPVELVLGKK